MKRKILANVLTLCMLFSMIPMTAFAAAAPSGTKVVAAPLGIGSSEADDATGNGWVTEEDYGAELNTSGDTNTISVTATGLKSHYSSDNDVDPKLGYWAGVGIYVPKESNQEVKYYQSWTAPGESTEYSTTDLPDGHVTDADGVTYDTFYFNLAGHTLTGRDKDTGYIGVQVGDTKTVFAVDFSGVTLAAPEIGLFGFNAAPADSEKAILDWHGKLHTGWQMDTVQKRCNTDTMYIGFDQPVVGNFTLEVKEPGTNGEVVMSHSVTNDSTAKTHLLYFSFNMADKVAGKEGSFANKALTAGTYTATLTIGDTEKTKELVINSVTFNHNNAVESTPATTEVVYCANGDEVTLPTVEKAGSVFTGWKVNDAATLKQAGDKITVSENTTCVAQWADPVTVTFELSGGTGSFPPVTVAQGGKVTVSEEPTRDQYIFDGWATRSATEPYTYTKVNLATATFSENTTLYAQWKSDSIASAKLYDSDDENGIAGVTVSTTGSGVNSILTISGIIPEITVGTADTYTLHYRLAGQENGTADKTATVKFTKTGSTITVAFQGLSNGATKLVVGDNQYGLAVGDLVEATIEAASTAKPTIPDTMAGTTDADKTALTDFFTPTGQTAKTVKTNETDALVAAAADQYATAEDNDAEINALKAAVAATEGNKIEVYLQVKPVEYVSATTVADTTNDKTQVSLKLEITPMMRVVASDSTPVEGVESVPITNFSVAETEAVEIVVPVPDNFIAAGSEDAVYVNHTKDNEFIETIKAAYDSTTNPKTVTFDAKNFSEYEIVVDGRKVTVTFGEGGSVVSLTPDKIGKKTTDLGVADPTPEEGKVFSGWGTGSNVIWAKDVALNDDILKSLIDGATGADNAKTITLAPIFTDVPQNNNTGGGGGVSSNVTIDRPTNGKVTVTPTAPSKGATVTINLTPDTGYAVGTVTVTDKDGKAVELTKVDDTHYTFVMPDGKVTVKATFTATATTPDGFTDVPADAYYADAVKWAVDKGITNGLTATTFGPNNSCTRGQMVTFLWRAAGSPAATGTNSFTDVASGEYYYNAVLWAVEKGITNGTTATTFSPNATVNRGQTVTFLYRYAESPAATGTSSFTDVAADAYYADAVKWAVAEGITNGTSDTTFAPASNCTRGQIVTFLYRQMAE